MLTFFLLLSTSSAGVPIRREFRLGIFGRAGMLVNIEVGWVPFCGWIGLAVVLEDVVALEAEVDGIRGVRGGWLFDEFLGWLGFGDSVFGGWFHV